MLCTAEVIGEDVTRVLATMGMVSTNVEDIKNLIERLSGQFKNVDNALSHTGLVNAVWASLRLESCSSDILLLLEALWARPYTPIAHHV